MVVKLCHHLNKLQKTLKKKLKMMRLMISKTFLLCLKKNCICFLFLVNVTVFSQDKPLSSQTKKQSLYTDMNEDDLMKTTNDLITRKEYNKATFFLSQHYSNFSNNLRVNWIYGYALSMNGDKKQAEAKYIKAISISPDNKNLQIDYARFLYDMGKIDKVASILSKFMDSESKNAELLLMQANISFWKGNLNNARKKIDRIQEIYPNSKITNSLAQQINELSAVYLKTNFEYQSDSQPLNFFAQHINLEQYKSRFLNPKLEISSYHFSPQKELAIIVKASNKFQFNRLKLIANLTGGVYKNLSGKADWVGGLNFSKKLIQNLSLNLGFSKKHELGTIASTAFNLTSQNVFGEIDYENKWLLFYAGYNQQFFEEDNERKLKDNEIQSIGTWVLTQPISIRKFNFQLGYSYSYTDAKDVLFFYDNEGVGAYDPYFTPKKQQIHSGLFIVNYKPTKKLLVEAKVNYGFNATIRNPYSINNIEVDGFYDETFTPVEYTGSISYNLSNGFGAKITYINQETFFYTRENINLGLNFNI